MASDNGADIETIGTRLVYQNRWMRVREDSIRYRDGSTGIYGVVEKPDFVVIAAIDDAGRLQLVQQFRYPVGARFWELPQGAWEQQPDADPIDVLRFLLDQNGLSQRDIATELGSESTVSLVLSGKRRLNRDHIARLSERFHVSPSVFF